MMSRRRPCAADLLEDNARQMEPELSLAKCQLTAVPDGVLRLAHGVHALDLSANKLRRLHFEEVAEASTTDGPEQRPDEQRLRRVVAGIRELNLSLNKLQSDDLQVFAHLRFWTGLLRLDLSGNGLQRLPSGFWGVLPSGLEELKLSFNCLAELPVTPSTPSLRQPEPYDGGTDAAKDRAPQELLPPSRLSILHVDGNALKDLPATLAFHCPHLTHLRCGDNVLKDLPVSWASFRGLTHLDLSDNRIVALPADRDLYASLAGTLVQLNLKGNEIDALPPAFSLLSSLEELDLRKNRIGSIPLETLDLPMLRVLDLSCNKLQRLELSERLTRLETLRLEHNQLQSLPSSIGSFTSLLRLYAHENKMQRLPDEIVNLTQLQELDIGRNQLIDIPEGLDDLKQSPTLAYFRKSLPDEVIPLLYIGGAESAANLGSLLHRKITLVVQLMVESEQHFPDHFSYLTYKISDHPTSDLAKHFDTCIEQISAAREEGGGVLVHCAAGISRSATIVAAFLMYHLKISCDEALDRLRRARPSVCPNPGFRAQLRDYERELFGPARRAPEMPLVQNKGDA